MSKILVFLADGFEEVEAVTPVDVLRRAGCEVLTVSVTGKKEVTSTHGITIKADILFGEADFSGVDMLVLPGGQPGTTALDHHQGLRQKLAGFAAGDRWIAAICAAPLVLGHLGLLKGKKATCYPGAEKELTGATFTGNPVEVDGKVITGRGPGVALAFSLVLAGKLMGTAVMEQIKEKMRME